MPEIGRGKASLEYFSAVMDMLLPLGVAVYSSHANLLAWESMDSLENMHAASAHLHKLQGVSPDEVINVTVTCDGTWSKRGFTATYGVVVVIAWETGQVLDFQIKSKCCMACALKLNSVDEDSEEFRMWWDGHRDVWGGIMWTHLQRWKDMQHLRSGSDQRSVFT